MERRCPVCNEPARLVGRHVQTPCVCPAGHRWFYCLAHGDPVRVAGERDPDRGSLECHCHRDAVPEAAL